MSENIIQQKLFDAKKIREDFPIFRNNPDLVFLDNASTTQKPQSVIDLQRDHAFKYCLPSVIRPDILLTETGWHIKELDSVPGGIGLTVWLNETYDKVIGGSRGMLEVFSGIFDQIGSVHIMFSV